MSKSLKILPVKKEIDPELEWVNPILPSVSKCFFLNIVAPPRSGKTNLICNLLANKDFYYGAPGDNPSAWDEIYYFSPSSRFDKTCSKILSSMDNVIRIDDLDELENSAVILQEIMNGQKDWDEQKEGRPRPRILAVFDDCLGILHRTGVANLSAKYRHYGMSVVVISQSYRKIPLTCRNCMTALIFFNLVNGKETEKVYDEVGSGVPDFYQHIKVLDRKYQFIYFNVENQEMYHNFERLLWSKDQYLED